MCARHWNGKEVRFHIILLLVYTLLFAVTVFFIMLVGGMTGNSDFIENRMTWTHLGGWYIALLLALAPIFYFRFKLFSGLSNFFFPEEEYPEAQPLYSRVEALEVQHDYQGAVSGWLDIIQSHPHLPKAYIRLMDLYTLYLDDYASMECTYRLAMAQVHKQQHRQELEAAYQLIQQRRGRI